MKIDYLSRFDRSFQKLEYSVQLEVRKAIESFLDHLVIGTRPQGLGLRRLADSFWEIRVGLKYRVLFEMDKDRLTFVLVGNHNEVRRFLRNI